MAIANPSEDPHNVEIGYSTTEGWPVTNPPPTVIPLLGGESTTISIGLEIPASEILGTSNFLTVTADLDGVPGTETQVVTEVRLLGLPEAVPSLIQQGLLLAGLLICVSGVAMLAHRKHRAFES